ncbi:hypothetical protein COCC4DRAFT_154708 [Bipolaris maydis ATCC 48331]|uniref:Uncharacterized protein n=2 Tax=Cochliobolus heterostrophus TaxID=5016 RepID=M2TT26_COCH5|nr:uncharacterized protein COCC4DRAFT_154708 [Bipolaris maydis ATCC 48331]EMD84931.1 hypothetical protein COCHEDRAFT_1120603 [Bipolaris maydis C5]KAJ5021262.1 hypothetical protein J3E73DRAFT_394661 [Bipolaris maydis]ENH98858.1 hypothetical protein COCC4DRAFT_154708 [Bipolaris maydis ATCC 48331]KAJ5025771.1 hypothetical protein J3E73DRAFT_191998 [Bipolaris maydis]KAJ5064384.1 hypothetical protein J3E74DRAFT_205874 [Bipolaris maydis]
MHANLLIALFATAFPVLVAGGWNFNVCNGAGGCYFFPTWSTSDNFVCPDGSGLSRYEFAEDQDGFGNGNGVPVSKEEFPKTCVNGFVPGPDAQLFKLQSRNNQTMYAAVFTTCDTPNPEVGNCYTADPNPTTSTFCAMYDPSGGLCELQAPRNRR